MKRIVKSDPLKSRNSINLSIKAQSAPNKVNIPVKANKPKSSKKIIKKTAYSQKKIQSNNALFLRKLKLKSKTGIAKSAAIQKPKSINQIEYHQPDHPYKPGIRDLLFGKEGSMFKSSASTPGFSLDSNDFKIKNYKSQDKQKRKNQYKFYY